MATASNSSGEADADAARALKIIESMPSHAWSADADGRFTYISPNTLTYLGSAPADFDRLPNGDEFGWQRFVHPDDYDRVAASWRHCLKTGDHHDSEHRLRRADGVYRWFRNSGRPSRDSRGHVTGWYGTTIDIEEQKQVEAALRDRERELSQLVDMVPSHLWRLTPDGEPVFFNKRMVDFLGLDVGDTDKPGMSRLAALVESIVHPDDAAGLANALNRCLVTGERFSMRYRLRRVDGAYRWMSSRAEPMRDQGGRIVQWYGLCHDIDDQMHADEALRRSERQLQQMIDAVPVRIWSATPAGGPAYFNKRYQDYLRSVNANFEAPEEPRIEEVVRELIHPEDAPEVQRTLRNSFETGAACVMRFRWREKDGAYRWAECRVEPRRDHDGAIVEWYGVSLDIHDEIRAQEALRQASDELARATQVASLAELSASIAHEVNQPLAAIVANSHACHRWLSAEPANVERAKITAERIIRDANSAADVVSRIRALFRQSVETRNYATLDGVIVEARDLIAEEAARRRVRMDVEVERDLPPVALDRVQVQQVLINLIRNGMEAMDSVTSDRVLRMRARRMGDVVQTEISDRGRGVEFPDKIFQPFFTTKENGMGMGLAICRSIVESHGGQLWAEENEPQGATFIFTLPVEIKTAP